MSGLPFLILLVQIVSVSGTTYVVPANGTIRATATSGYIVSGNFPGNYSNNVNGSVLFVIPNPAGKALVVVAESFDVEDNEGVCIDSVRFHIKIEETWKQYAVRCGPSVSTSFHKLLFQNTYVRLSFITNGNVTKSGFKLSYSVVALPRPSRVPSFLCGKPAVMPCLPTPSSNSACRNRIVNGADALPKSWPWHAGLTPMSRKDVAFCGGSVIHPCWILTSAACVFGRNITTFGIKVGTNLMSENRTILAIQNVVIHPGFNREVWNLDYDVALIKLDKCLDFNTTVRPVCVTKETDALVSGKEAVTVGWGALNETATSLTEKLQEVQLTIKPRAVCQTQYDWVNLTESMMCAGAPGKDNCYGDSGGGLFYRNPDSSYRVVGLASFGNACAASDGVYTNIRAVLDWLKLYVSNI